MSKATEFEFYPFIQTHTFEVEPFLKRTQGYAPFIASLAFSGKEQVNVVAAAGKRFPDTDLSERRLDEFSNGKWFLSDSDRVASATSGPLERGKYLFRIEGLEGISSVEFDFHPQFLEPVNQVNLQDGDEVIKVSWVEPPGADNYWLFAIPANANRFIENLVPVTENLTKGHSAALKKAGLARGTYRIAIRANQMWRRPPFKGFISESWSLSSGEFNVP